MGTINMRLFLLAGTLLFAQLSQQAAVLEAAEDVSELAFPDGEVEEPSPREDDDTGSGDDEYGSGDYEYYAEPYDYPYYWCKCSFDEYEEYYGVASVMSTPTSTPGVPASSTRSTTEWSTPWRRSLPARRLPGVWTGRRRSTTPGGVWTGRGRRRSTTTPAN